MPATSPPPNYDRIRGPTDTLIDMKRRFKDPYIIVAGDFNQWQLDLADISDMKEIQVGCTRGSRSLDRFFSNLWSKVAESGTIAPLETEGEILRASDHRTAHCKILLPRREVFRWETYTYRHYSEEAVRSFKNWVVMHDWDKVLTANGSECKAAAYKSVLTAAIERYFPLKTRKKKSTDLPWMTDGIKKQIKKRKELFAREDGRR